MKFQKAVKDIVGYAHQSGDLNMEYFSVGRAELGTKAHQKVQKKYEKNECEVSITHTMQVDWHEITMNGRMDLLLKKGTNWVVGEIKSTTRRLDYIQENDRPAHYAQAKFYAYFLMAKHAHLESITVRLIYCDIDGKKTRHFDQIYSQNTLEEFVIDTLRIYLKWAEILHQAGHRKLATSTELTFPFGDFREYQRELSGSVYHCIKNRKHLLLRAATGIGKTMATVFPSLKAISEPEQKIFYFTAKTLGRTVAEKAFLICQKKGLEAKVTTITAKEKICFMDETRCDPTYCPYALGYFDRVREATDDLFQSASLFNREIIEIYADKHQICPFEFSLAMASVSDIVIGDYNYLFDPRAYLKRFFDEPSEHIALIDEAHNLYDRACEMFSASLTKNAVFQARKSFKGRQKSLMASLDDLLLIFDRYEDERIRDLFRRELDENLLDKVDNTMEILERYLHRNPNLADRSQWVNFYFELLQFSRISTYYTDSFRFRMEEEDGDYKVSIICLNPGIHLANRLENLRSGILFSATLHPLDYFQKILLNDAPAEQLFLPSPFQRENLDLRVHQGLSTKYKDRSYSALGIVDHIHELTSEETGNYLVFFPSYQYMEQIFEQYEAVVSSQQVVVMQKRNMNEADREIFLAQFSEPLEKSLVAFVVLGGIFSEGIDLVGDLLIGAVIVGVGLPQINPLLEERRQYFQETFGAGYPYAYIIPGFNKVMQAVGRVIRTEDDKGTVLLIDTRYGQREYLELFPYEWQHARFKR